MKNNAILIAIVALFIGGVAGFFAGQNYQGKQTNTNFQFGNGQRGIMNNADRQFQNSGNRIMSRQIVGEIISQDDKSLTVQLPDGSTRIVILSDKTVINKATEVSKSDLKVGERVGVFGQTNTDGSVTAQNIQLNPIVRNISPTVTK